MRPAFGRLPATSASQVAATPPSCAVRPATTVIRQRSAPVTDDMVARMADEAERGYDVAGIRGRSASDLLRAAELGVSVSEATRAAGGE